MSLDEIYTFLTFLFFGYTALALYVDRLLPDDGARLPPWFCFTPSFWCSSKATDPSAGDSDVAAGGFEEMEGADEDVTAEADAAKARVGVAMDPDVAGAVLCF